VLDIPLVVSWWLWFVYLSLSLLFFFFFFFFILSSRHFLFSFPSPVLFRAPPLEQ